MVALEPLVEAAWMRAPLPEELREFDDLRVDFGRALPWRMAKLREAAAGFFAALDDDAALRAEYEGWVAAEAGWLEDYALFSTLDAQHQANVGGFADWTSWPRDLARRDAAALAEARELHAHELSFWRFVQFCFDRQWHALRRYANERGVRIVGDLPIFVAAHGADCWSRPDLYLLDEDLRPRVVAGVPPDFFSETGQRWGNPLYDWAAMADDGYAWWVARVRRQLALVDLVRVDHFRGFAASWEIDADSETAVDGRWVPGPGAALFEALRAELGRPAGTGADELPLIAEDLGVITEDVEQLRDSLGLPGMKILQFAFSEDAEHPFLPHNYPRACVAYTGTHDNDTVHGWYDAAPPRERALACAYLDLDGEEDVHDLHWAMIRALSGSTADTVVFPLQDVLGLDGSHRMNVPGEVDCWTWRFVWDMVGPEPAPRLARISAACGRAPFSSLELPG
jgi:4-alpha-glucanotransferase